MHDVPRPKILSISMTLQMPDGSRRVNTLDPEDCDALVWSDRAAEIFAKFYAPGGPAEGKIVSRDHLVQHFGPGVETLLQGATELMITPEVVQQLWHLDEGEGAKPAYLAKSTANPINGFLSTLRLDQELA